MSRPGGVASSRSRLRRGGVAALVAVLAAAPLASGCYAPQLALLKSGLDSLRTVVDTIVVRDSVAYTVLAETRREMAEQRDILLSTRATTGSTTQEVFEQMSRLQGRLDEVLQRFQTISERTGPAAANPAASAAPDPAQLYDQATQDLTQGRYPLALSGYRDLLRRFPTAELADNAQYGVGECFFAQAVFDSAALEYARVGEVYPQGDRVPAALYKLALSQEKLGRTSEFRKTLQDLVQRFPSSGEAQLARERIGRGSRR